jgi:hypothetical protein
VAGKVLRYTGAAQIEGILVDEDGSIPCRLPMGARGRPCKYVMSSSKITLVIEMVRQLSDGCYCTEDHIGRGCPQLNRVIQNGRCSFRAAV